MVKLKKFTKLLIFLGIELTIISLFMAYSQFSALVSTVVFPPIFAVTLYFFVVTALDFKRDSFKRMDFVYALLLASMALISSASGFHYATNDINDIFIPTLGFDNTNHTFYINQQVLERVDYLDENFSHMVMAFGFFGVIASMILWWYFRRFSVSQDTEQVQPLAEETIFDYFVIIFVGSLIGAFTSLSSIQAQVLNYGVAFLAILSILLFVKFRKARKSPISKHARDIMMFCITFTASYFAVTLAYYILKFGNMI